MIVNVTPKPVKVLAALAMLMLFVTLILPDTNTPGQARSNFEFAPLLAVAPDDLDTTTVGSSYSCDTSTLTSVGPVYKSLTRHCYDPATVYAAYGVNRLHAEGITGRGETIVIVDSYGSPTAQQDLDTFSTAFGLPHTQIEFIYPDGQPTYNTTAPTDQQSGWAYETSLDLQWAHAIAPDARLVLVAANPQESEGVQGFPSIFKGEQIAIQRYPGAVLSQSFAVTEQSFHAAAPTQVANFDQVYQQAVANRVTVLGSSGDSGTANGDKQSSNSHGSQAGSVYPYPTANWPASDPLVTAAGGTWLQYNWKWNPLVSAADFYNCLNTPATDCYNKYLNSTSGTGRTEAVWKEDWLPAAGGGAQSYLFATPAFQSGISQSILQGRRGVPDLSWNAAVDGGALVYTTFGGVRPGWHVVGGTSAAAPQLAGLVTLANQLAHNQGKPSVGYLNPLLYQLPARDFQDIVPQAFGSGAGATTLDSNAEYGSGIAGSPTTSGYDLSTGLGTPKAYEFVHDLVGLIN